VGPFAIERGDGRIESDAADEPFENQHTGGSLCSTLATQYRRHGVCLLRWIDDAAGPVLPPIRVKSPDQTFFGTKNRCQEASASTGLETPIDAGQPFLNGSTLRMSRVKASGRS